MSTIKSARGRASKSLPVPPASVPSPETRTSDINTRSPATPSLVTTFTSTLIDSGDTSSMAALAYEVVVPDFTPLSSLLTSELVATFIGPTRKAFHIHQDLLCDRSTYFKAAFRGKFEEAATKELYLVDDDDAAFELFVNWLYGANLKAPANEKQLPCYLALVALSEKFMVEHLGNIATDLVRTFYQDSETQVRAQDLAFAYTHIDGEKIKIFMTALMVLQVQMQDQVTREFFPGIQDLLASEGAFAKDVAWFLMQQPGSCTTTIKIGRLLYHEISCFFHRHEYTPKCKGRNLNSPGSFRGLVGLYLTW